MSPLTFAYVAIVLLTLCLAILVLLFVNLAHDNATLRAELAEARKNDHRDGAGRYTQPPA